MPGSKPGERRGGRKKGTPNKATAEIKELAQQYGLTALKTLSDIAQDDQAPHAARVSASNSLLDRGYGKAPQAVEHTGKDGAPIEIKKVERVVVDPNGKTEDAG